MAIKRLQFSGQTGLTGYALIWDENDKIFNTDTVEAETYDNSNLGDYKVSVPEIGSTGHYSADPPSSLPIGKYHVQYKHQAGASPAQSDQTIFQANIGWDGSQIVDDLVIGSSVADICNQALSHLGIGKEIANLETETSAEAQACRRFYETARDTVLRAFPWGFARRVVTLGLVEEDPTEEWDYSYRYPSSALYAVRILSGVRVDDRNSRIPYEIYGDDSGRLLYTDKETAQLEYVARVENPLRYTPDFIAALGYRLASFIAPRLTSGDAFKLGEKALQLYAIEVRNAMSQSGNESVRDLPPEAETITVRG